MLVENVSAKIRQMRAEIPVISRPLRQPARQNATAIKTRMEA